MTKNKQIINILLLLILFFFLHVAASNSDDKNSILSSGAVFAQEPAESAEPAKEAEPAAEEEEENPNELKYSGKVSSRNVININGEIEESDVLQKNELKHAATMQYGSDVSYLKLYSKVMATPYLVSDSINDDFVYNDEFEVKRNLQISGRGYEVLFNELYYNYENDLGRIRIGNQLYAWGNADVNNPTSYFNPNDTRELFFKEKDEVKMGVPSISALFDLAENSIEIVIVPLHIPSLIAEQDNFWGYKYSEPGKFKAVFDKTTDGGMEFSPENIGTGCKVKRTIGDWDLAVSYYHGPDKDPIFRPYEYSFPAKDITNIIVKPEYYVINSTGIATTTTISDFTVQGQATYTFDKKGLYDYSNEEFDSSDKESLPIDVKQSGLISYSMGFNYFVPLKITELIITAEWFQSKFLDNQIKDPNVTDILTMRIQDTFLDGNLEPALQGMYLFKDKNIILMPNLKYKIQNELDIEATFAYIKGNKDTVLEVYDNYRLFIMQINYIY